MVSGSDLTRKLAAKSGNYSETAAQRATAIGQLGFCGAMAGSQGDDLTARRAVDANPHVTCESGVCADRGSSANPMAAPFLSGRIGRDESGLRSAVHGLHGPSANHML